MDQSDASDSDAMDSDCETSDEKEKSCARNFFKSCLACQCCGWGCCGVITCLLIAIISVFFVITRSPVALVSYDAATVVPSVAAKDGFNTTIRVGNKDNIKTSIPLDLGGVWWIRYNNSEAWAWNKLYFELGLTFAGMTSNTTGEPWFPAKLKIPAALKHQWMFSSSLVSRVTQIIKGESQDPRSMMTISMWNSTHGYVHPDTKATTWLFTKISEDVWLRRTYFDLTDPRVPAYAKPLGPGPFDYKLTRIVRPDGTPTQFYDAWKEEMRWIQVRSFSTDDRCIRKWGSIFSWKWLVDYLC